jgi:hypothetical protein
VALVEFQLAQSAPHGLGAVRASQNEPVVILRLLRARSSALKDRGLRISMNGMKTTCAPNILRPSASVLIDGARDNENALPGEWMRQLGSSDVGSSLIVWDDKSETA